MVEVEFSAVCQGLLDRREVAVEGILTDHDHSSLVGVHDHLPQLVHDPLAY
jgi:hypothetical protein